MEKGRIEFNDPSFRGRIGSPQRIRDLVNGVLNQNRQREIEWYESLLSDLKAGNIDTAIESVEGAIEVLKR